MKKRTMLIGAIVALSASPLLAHGGGAHLKGTVAAISAERITVKDSAGNESEAQITRDTRFVRGKAAGTRDELREGDRVVVHTRKQGKALEAVEIHYGAKKTP